MKPSPHWSARPYRPLDRQAEAELPFICRIAPGEGYADIEWFDRGFSGAHELLLTRLTDGAERRLALDGPTLRLKGLAPDGAYALQVARVGQEGASERRLFRTGFVPGDAVVAYLHPQDEAFAFSGRALCSPSIAQTPSGRLVVSMDVYAPRAPQNLTILYASRDGGKSFRYLCDLFPCFWGKLFCHRGRLYMLAHASEYGDVLIGASDDEGETWSTPSVLFRGSGHFEASGPHKAPMPVIEHGGRLFTALDYGCWAKGGHASGMLSAPADANLLDPASWTLSDAFLPYDPAWPGAARGPAKGGLEGNMVVSPHGELLNVLRYQISEADPCSGLSLQLRADAARPERPLVFCRIAPMQGGSNAKFNLLHDPVSGKYVAVANAHVPGMPANMRNVLILAVSDDLLCFRTAKMLLDYRHLPPQDVGFQYCDFLFDGQDLVFVCRTAFGGARNFHDANYTTFHRLPGFRQYL